VPKVVARVNDPRNHELFELLEIAPTVSATSMVMALIGHEVPEHELVHLLELRKCVAILKPGREVELRQVLLKPS
jgi:hypothetical protein